MNSKAMHNSFTLLAIIRLSAKGTEGVMKPGCYRLKYLFIILSTEAFGTL